MSNHAQVRMGLAKLLGLEGSLEFLSELRAERFAEVTTNSLQKYAFLEAMKKSFKELTVPDKTEKYVIPADNVAGEVYVESGFYRDESVPGIGIGLVILPSYVNMPGGKELNGYVGELHFTTKKLHRGLEKALESYKLGNDYLTDKIGGEKTLPESFMVFQAPLFLFRNASREEEFEVKVTPYIPPRELSRISSGEEEALREALEEALEKVFKNTVRAAKFLKEMSLSRKKRFEVGRLSLPPNPLSKEWVSEYRSCVESYLLLQRPAQEILR